jgi:hypothetical protein
MKGVLQFLFLSIVILIVFGCENQSGEKVKPEVNLVEQSTANEKEKQVWRNPTITPFGKDLPSVLRGYFLVGDFDKMLQFMIWPKDIDSNEIRRIIQKSTWGYEIKVTNLKWQDDTSFVLTIRSTIQNTVGMEQYEGKIQNDTAKLILIPNSTKLFAL